MISGAFRLRRRRFLEGTGETSRTAPESGLRGAGCRDGRPSTPARRRRAPGRLGQPRGPRAVARRPRTGAVGVVALRSVWTASRGSERSAHTPSARRVRRQASPRLCCCRGMQSVRRYWSNRAPVAPPGLDATSCPHRFGCLVIDAARLTRLLSHCCCQNVALRAATFSFLSIQAKTRPTHAAWAASMRRAV